MVYDWDFQGILQYKHAFLRGAWITLQLGILSSLFGTVAGVPVAFLERIPVLGSSVVKFIIEAFRAIPNLVLIFFFYYFPYEDVLGMQTPTAFASTLWALAASQAAYSAELFRVALSGLPRDQLQGLRALGFKRSHIAIHLGAPSLVKQTLPGHIALWIGNFKLSSLSSVVGVHDVVFVARVAMAQTFRSLEAWVVVGAIYLIVVLPLTYALRLVEKSNWMRRQ